MKIDWVRKLTSRKFWAAVASFVTCVLVMFNVADNTITQVAALIGAAGTMVAYIIGEGLTDAAAINTSKNNSPTNEEDK